MEDVMQPEMTEPGEDGVSDLPHMPITHLSAY